LKIKGNPPDFFLFSLPHFIHTHTHTLYTLVLFSDLLLFSLSLSPYQELDFSVYDPSADGHCGFRCLAKAIYGNEDDYQKVKNDMMKVLVGMIL
jgi:hypothetical protein